MHIHAHKLLGFSLGAADGEIGTVKDIYFDDNNWIVRYLVVETGNWLFKRRVLISPCAVVGDIKNNILQVNLNKEQIKNSPDINTDMPVSRQQESSLTNHYSWPSFGRAGLGWPTTGMIKGASALVNKVEGTLDFDPHLRSFSHVAQYEVYNEDGRVGLVKDLAIDFSDWSIPFLLLDDASTSDQERVVISTKRIASIDWETFQVKVSINNEDLQKAFRINSQGFFADDSDTLPI
jgi:sporulation protein YlmC with PRC-barrel domain